MDNRATANPMKALAGMEMMKSMIAASRTPQICLRRIEPTITPNAARYPKEVYRMICGPTLPNEIPLRLNTAKRVKDMMILTALRMKIALTGAGFLVVIWDRTDMILIG